MATEKPGEPIEAAPVAPPEMTFAEYCAEAAIPGGFAAFVGHLHKFKSDSKASREAFAAAVANSHKARI